jgi:nanoRNase/pAp phosphatase (c-di-AMP/oligoRNAs hydrolase)
MDDVQDPRQHIIESLKQANNILVTVRSSPSIDQLAACIALTLVLNELDKHGTAVFSGQIPSVIEFLEPGKIIERNTDSLQDFIISLDKSKADKLRYKVEDSVVRIFITPYRTSISEKDLEFGQGDFNVDVVVALGVHNQADLDQAITSHGRILHDATVISINTEPGGGEELGSINWIDTTASSLSEIVASFAGEMGKADVIDNQVATALLTGIVAETERFGNGKTTPQTMETAAKLLTAGANQELVATKLSESQPATAPPATMQAQPSDDNHDTDGGTPAGGGTTPSTGPQDGGMLEITHPGGSAEAGSANANATSAAAAPAVVPTPTQPPEADLAHMSQPFAHEGDSFDISQPTENLMPALQAASEPASNGDGVPPVYSPGQDPPGGRAGIASFSQPPSAPPTSAKQVQAEEQAALELIKERKVPTENHRTIIQPLHDQGAFLDTLPQENQSVTPVPLDPNDIPSAAPPAPAEGTPPEVKGNAWELSPPSMGGTLTANSTPDHESPSDGRTISNKAAAPLLTHAAPAASAAPASQPEPTLKPAPPEHPVPELPKAPAPAPASPPAALKPARPTPAPQTSRTHETLAEIERRMHSPHVDSAQATKPAPTAPAVTPTVPLVPPTAPPVVTPAGEAPKLEAALTEEHATLQPQQQKTADMPKPAAPATKPAEEAIDPESLITPLMPPPTSPPPVAAAASH